MTNPRHILAIECSNPGSGPPGVALGVYEGTGLRVVGVENVRPSGRGGHDDDLMPAIDRLFRAARLSPRDGALDRVAVSIGPGGYTSVRVACAVGKMIAEPVRARCVAVPTALVAVESSSGLDRAAPVAVALAGKGDSAWVQIIAGGVPASDGRVMTHADIAGLAASGVRTLIADSFLPAPMRSAAESASMRIIAPRLTPVACLHLGARLPVIDPAELVPLYPREPDAVTLWRARHTPRS